MDRAFIAHAQGDQARMGHGHYLAAASGVDVFESPLGDIHIGGLKYGASGKSRMILPSFGAFTGGFLIAPEAGDAIYASSGEAVHLVR